VRQVDGAEFPLQHVVHHGPVPRGFADGLRVTAIGGHESLDRLGGVRHLTRPHHLALRVHDGHVGSTPYESRPPSGVDLDHAKEDDINFHVSFFR
jgi:hypothetical protein